MNTSYTLQINASTILDKVRKRTFGEEATVRDYRDSYVLGNAIENFSFDDIQKLLEYREKDVQVQKIAKSVTLKANVYSKLVKISEHLRVSESETCRLILFYLDEEPSNDVKKEMPGEITIELAVLKKALNDAGKALKAIEDYYNE